MPKAQRIFFSIITGVLLSLPWYDGISGLLLCIGLIPLLIVEDYYYKSKLEATSDIFWYSFLSFFTWHLLDIWWISNASLVGAMAIILTNSLLYSFVFWLFHYSKKITKRKAGNFYLLIYWTAFEYVYLNTEISWPWLNLGNGLSGSIKLIQWYEYTGTLGGTIWILIVNLLAASLIITFTDTKTISIKKSWISAIAIFLPLIISTIIFYTYKEKEDPVRITIIQPNIDPYKDKFDGLTPAKQLNILLEEASKTGDTAIDYFVGPETAILGENPENDIGKNWAVSRIRCFLKKYRKAKFIIGAETSKDYSAGEKLSVTSRKHPNTEVFYDIYNSALQIDNSSKVQIYHKSKLVIGVEKMPYLKYFHFLENFSLNFGGTYGSLGSQTYRGTFVSNDRNKVVAPVICYESIYGEYVSDYIKNGASLIFITTNDGWWGNTPGHRQHLNYSKLRAIETRRSIARSANTGISAFINQRGEIINSLSWWERGCLTGIIHTNDKLTFYVKYGDYLGRIAMYLSLMAICYIIYLNLKNRVKT